MFISYDKCFHYYDTIIFTDWCEKYFAHNSEKTSSFNTNIYSSPFSYYFSGHCDSSTHRPSALQSYPAALQSYPAALQSYPCTRRLDPSTHLSTQFPSHGLGEPLAYGFSDLPRVPPYSVVVNIMKFYRHDRDSNPDRCGENQTC